MDVSRTPGQGAAAPFGGTAASISYDVAPLRMRDLPGAPGPAFAGWFSDAQQAGVPEPNAMVLATVAEDGTPAVRTVLLRGVSELGFRFFTNYDSAKGRHLAARPQASLLFVWLALHRQVSITGVASRLPEEDSDEYFAQRPTGSKLAAWASPQSQRIADRAWLHRQWQRFADQYPDGPVPRPPHWGGFEVAPSKVEFWQGQPSRLHDRIVYEACAGGGLREAESWQRYRLAP